MGYAVTFKVKAAGTDKYIDVGNCKACIPWDVCEIITHATGLMWEKCANNRRCIDVIPYIEKGYTALLKHPDRYVQYGQDVDIPPAIEKEYTVFLEYPKQSGQHVQYTLIDTFDRGLTAVTGVKVFLSDILNAWFDFCTDDTNKDTIKSVIFCIE